MNNFEKIGIISLLSLVSCSKFGHAEGQTAKIDSIERHECEMVFNRAIYLNEQFKKSVKTATLAKQKKLRKQVEKFYEDTLTENIPGCVTYAAQTADTSLSRLFFRLVDSHGNSADELLPFALGVYYFYNQEMTNNILLEYSALQRKVLSESIIFGLEALAYDKRLSKTQLDSLKQKLDDLKSVNIR